MKLVIFIYRIGNWFYKRGFVQIALIISTANRFVFSCWLPCSASIGRNFRIGYGGLGVVIHSQTVIGENVTIAQNVTIGRNFGDRGVPKIGSDVYIGAGTVVFGEIEIGDNVIIGANSVINKSIKSNSTVAGNPMRVLVENRQKRYYEIDKNYEH